MKRSRSYNYVLSDLLCFVLSSRGVVLAPFFFFFSVNRLANFGWYALYSLRFNEGHKSFEEVLLELGVRPTWELIRSEQPEKNRKNVWKADSWS